MARGSRHSKGKKKRANAGIAKKGKSETKLHFEDPKKLNEASAGKQDYDSEFYDMFHRVKHNWSCYTIDLFNDVFSNVNNPGNYSLCFVTGTQTENPTEADMRKHKRKEPSTVAMHVASKLKETRNDDNPELAEENPTDATIKSVDILTGIGDVHRVRAHPVEPVLAAVYESLDGRQEFLQVCSVAAQMAELENFIAGTEREDARTVTFPLPCPLTYALRFSPKGKYLALAGEDNAVHVYEINSSDPNAPLAVELTRPVPLNIEGWAYNALDITWLNDGIFLVSTNAPSGGRPTVCLVSLTHNAEGNLQGDVVSRVVVEDEADLNAISVKKYTDDDGKDVTKFVTGGDSGHVYCYEVDHKTWQIAQAPCDKSAYCAQQNPPLEITSIAYSPATAVPIQDEEDDEFKTAFAVATRLGPVHSNQPTTSEMAKVAYFDFDLLKDLDDEEPEEDGAPKEFFFAHNAQKEFSEICWDRNVANLLLATGVEGTDFLRVHTAGEEEMVQMEVDGEEGDDVEM
ncbi:Histone-binding protein RBBP4 or subunit C of CAF1 complex [Carpediemonas membranifera]|uniref:Histone-binding protein RBBP4 or subunit C of CAF1 complex n=1 Tax=Carpediemonas membranifera TaxID=201153 RepID=A0A8J6E891_9EUKA|nr:Histone-binding protein RBBP4 or subunit C of CAF1 complex [Carpediemonas membranifera]|eukprot:KAG9391570.1 Histone-binding protein RBBP4 or subunit C of CAF1 complex [Carpediemonas membranifera]